MAKGERADQDNYKHLATAIVCQAVEDYLNACREEADAIGHASPAELMGIQKRKREVERFFSSKWIRQLTDRDPKRMLRKLNEIA